MNNNRKKRFFFSNNELFNNHVGREILQKSFGFLTDSGKENSVRRNMFC